MTVELFEPILEGGIRTTHFFNGRLLTAGDFQALEQAVLERESRLGRAIGEGVVVGFEVSLDQAHSTITHPIVTVTRGLAINGRGEALALPADTTVALTREPTVTPLGEAGFHACPPPGPPPPPPGGLTNLGFYILTVLPASGFEGRAPMTQLVEEGVSGSCGSRYAVSGVRFRLARVPLAADGTSTTLRQQVVQVATDLDTLIPQLGAPNPPLALQQEVFRKTSLVRNGLAHLCFGSDRWSDFPTDPLPFLGSGSMTLPARTFLDDLRADGVLTDAEVPLGLVSWTSRGVTFLDQWAVRREALPTWALTTWPQGASGPRACDGVARSLQFQRHADDLGRMTGISLPLLRAIEWFYYLPSIGVLPVNAPPMFPGFDYQRFFDPRPMPPPVYIEGAKLLWLARTAFAHPAIATGSEETNWLYRVRENMQGMATPGGAVPCLVFVNGHVRYEGEAQYNLSYWDYANYA